eukprot:3220069-Pleurochrysis_carterae.AAC.2
MGFRPTSPCARSHMRTCVLLVRQPVRMRLYKGVETRTSGLASLHQGVRGLRTCICRVDEVKHETTRSRNKEKM